MSSNLHHLTTITTAAPICDINIHTMPNESTSDRGFVALFDRCPNQCKVIKTFFRNLSVMYDLAWPVDTSHQIKLLSNDLSN